MSALLKISLCTPPQIPENTPGGGCHRLLVGHPNAHICVSLCYSGPLNFDSLSGLLNEKENRLNVNLSHKIEHDTSECGMHVKKCPEPNPSANQEAPIAVDMHHSVSSDTYFIKYSFLLPVMNSYKCSSIKTKRWD